jgi:hypothetical protein
MYISYGNLGILSLTGQTAEGVFFQFKYIMLLIM